MITEFNKFRW